MHHLVKCHSFLFRSRSASTQPHHIDRLQCSSYYFKREDCFKLPGAGQVKRPPSRYQARITVQVRSPVSRSHARTSHSYQHNFTLYVGNVTQLFLRYRTECWFQHDFTLYARRMSQDRFSVITLTVDLKAFLTLSLQEYHTWHGKSPNSSSTILAETRSVAIILVSLL